MNRIITTRNNPHRLKSAAISILSGDTTMTFSRMLRITAFKAVYYLFTLQTWQQSRIWRRHVQILETAETAAE
jgi:hypothetical protein